MSALWRLRVYIWPQLPRLLAAYACMLVLALATAALAFLSGPALHYVFTGRLADVLQAQSGVLRLPTGFGLGTGWMTRLARLGTGADAFQAPQLGPWIVPLALCVTAVCKGVAQAGQFYLLGRSSQRIVWAIRRDAFAALMRQPPAFYAQRAHGDLLSRLTHDIGIIEQALFYGCGPILRDTLGVLVLLCLCVSMEPFLALANLVVIPVALWPLTGFAHWLKRVSLRSHAAQGGINAVCYQALAGVRVVQACQAEHREGTRLAEATSQYAREMTTSYLIRAMRTPTMETLGALAFAGLLAYLGHRVQHQHVDPAPFISFFAAALLMYDPLKKLGHVSEYLVAGAAAAERVCELIDVPPDVRDRPGAATLRGAPAHVRFIGVHFAYQARPVLRGIDLTLERGEQVALVGPSGAGKSTLAHLLPRFYDVTGGQLMLGAHDVRDVTLQSLRDQISIVSQETFLFNASVRDNVAYGRPEACMADIVAACQAAHAYEFIQMLPRGFDTRLGERGLTLSGGQRQRLAIARALLRNTPLLILDEATSNLDTDSEGAVQAALQALLRGRTALIIAHRLTTVRGADRIAVLQGGRILEQGTHARLMAQGGEYARLYAIQVEVAHAPFYSRRHQPAAALHP